jgi:D-tyrosyl-tRNA(Tyr) deacylase
MRAVIQRVSQAGVDIDGHTVASIAKGLVVLLGVARDDSAQHAEYLAEKIANLRIFEDREGKMNLSLKDVGGDMLVVSQFTLLGDCRKGRRPSFVMAAPPQEAESLYNHFVAHVQQMGIAAATGRFRTTNQVSLVNDGPVTLFLEV